MPRSPFLLDERSKTEPSRYEIDLVLNGVLHHYRFSLGDDRVVEESASWYPNGRAVRLFERDLQGVTLGATHRAKGRAAIGILRPNALFPLGGGADRTPGPAASVQVVRRESADGRYREPPATHDAHRFIARSCKLPGSGHPADASGRSRNHGSTDGRVGSCHAGACSTRRTHPDRRGGQSDVRRFFRV